MLWSRANNTFDNRPHAMETDWATFCALASDIQRPDKSLPAKEAKKFQMAWLPAVWESRPWPEVTLRGSSGIVGGWVIPLDFDNAYHLVTGFNEDGTQIVETRQVEAPAHFEEVEARLQALGLRALLYTTFSHTPGHHKFRGAIPVDRMILPQEWPQAVEYLLETTALNRWRHCLDIKAMRNAAGLYYLANDYNGEPQRTVLDGAVLHLPTDLTNQTLPNLPNTTRFTPEALAQHARIQSTLSAGAPDTYWWLEFGIDMTTLDLPMFLRKRGYQVDAPRPYGMGLKYTGECPFWQEHSDASDRNGFAIFEQDGRWPGVDCKHTHDLKLKHLFLEPWRFS